MAEDAEKGMDNDEPMPSFRVVAACQLLDQCTEIRSKRLPIAGQYAKMSATRLRWAVADGRLAFSGF